MFPRESDNGVKIRRICTSADESCKYLFSTRMKYMIVKVEKTL